MIRISVIVYFILCSVAHAAEQAESRNAVAGHDSPYLNMHGSDPVQWLPWSNEILELARQQNKPIFVTVGYFSCYWCHVMQKESFVDENIAKVLNRYFIPVVVDRELNPALDAQFVTFMNEYRGGAGWPMNIFLTPEGYPLIGSLYMTQPQLLDLLVKLVARWQSDSDKLKAVAEQVHRQKKTVVKTSPDIEKGTGTRLLQKFAHDAMQIADTTAGGFGDQSKFPMPAQVTALMDYLALHPEPDIREFLLLTLDEMASQGLRDHLDGGFFRYTVDPAWKAPHFEKMLYDNALLSLIYLRAATQFNNKRYETIASDTLTFLSERFLTDKGGMVSSFSAVDDKGVEGAYYTWSNEDLEAALSKDEQQVIRFAWNMFGPYPLEEGYIPVNPYSDTEIASYLKLDAAQVTTLLASARKKLRKERSKRTLPVDTKILAAWNGLALQAFSLAAARLDNSLFRKTADRLRNYIVNELWDGRTLRRAISRSDSMRRGKLEDYAFVAQGLYAYAALVNRQADRQLASDIAHAGWKRFFDDSGWHLADEHLLPIETGQVLLDDGALPSASATLIRTSLDIAAGSRDRKLQQLALGALNNGHTILTDNPFNYASTIAALATLD